MSWQKTITTKGIALQAKILAGADVIITRAAVGGGAIPFERLAELTDVVGHMTEVKVDVKLPVLADGRATIKTVVSNLDINNDLIYHQIGVFAKDPDEGEILYLIAQNPAGNQLPSTLNTPEFKAQYDFEILVSITSDIKVEYKPSDKVTQEQLEALRDELIPHASTTTVFGVGSPTHYGHLKAETDGTDSLSLQKRYVQVEVIDLAAYTDNSAKAGRHDFDNLLGWVNVPEYIPTNKSGYIVVFKSTNAERTTGVELHIHGLPAFWSWGGSWARVGDSGNYRIFGVAIDLTESDPERAVTYTDDAVGMIPGSEVWEDQPIFKDIRPCTLRLGVRLYYLDRFNFTKKQDGTAARLNGDDGDVMIEIPKIGYQIKTEGNILTVRITDHPNQIGFHYYAHTRITEGDRDKLYIGAYHASLTPSGTIWSVSGLNPLSPTKETMGLSRNPTVSEAMNWMRQKAKVKAKGVNFDLMSFHAMTLLQCLFLIRFKHRDSQEVLGVGFTHNKINTPIAPTGANNHRGMFYGTPLSFGVDRDPIKDRLKCFGIEDLWGNVTTLIDGLVILGDQMDINVGCANFNNSGTGYTSYPSNLTSPTPWGFMTAPQGTSECGFLAKTTQDTPLASIECFADTASLKPQSLITFGGHLRSGDGGAGIFHTWAHSMTDDITANHFFGARIMYL